MEDHGQTILFQISRPLDWKKGVRMKATKSHLFFVLRLGVAAVLAVAAMQKLRNLQVSENSLVEFGVPRRFGRPIGRALIATELLVAFLILVPATAVLGLASAVAMLATFSAAISRQLLLGRRPSCGCFGDSGEQRISGRTLIRNGAMILSASLPLLEMISRRNSNVALWMSSSAKALVFPTLTVANSILLVRLLRQFGEIVIAIRGNQRRLGVGDVIPDFGALDAKSRGKLSLGDLLSSDRSIVVFVSPQCTFCNKVYSEIAAYKGRRRIAVITSGSIDDAQDLLGRLAGVIVVVDENAQAGEAFLISATPSAFALDSNGALENAPAEGADEVLRLLLDAF